MARDVTLICSEKVHEMPQIVPDCPGGRHTTVTTTAVSYYQETQKALWKRYNGSWRELADELGIAHSVLHAIATDKWEHVSWDMIRRIGVSLGLPNPGQLRIVLPCPSCGAVHGEGLDCGGRPIAAVVILQPGERVAPGQSPGRRRSSYASISIPRKLREELVRIKEREKITWTELLTRLLLQQPR